MESQVISRFGSTPFLRKIYLKRKSPRDPRLDVAMPLAAEIFRSLDLWLDQHLGLHAGYGVRHVDKIGAAQVRHHHRRQRHRRSENTTAQKRR